MRIPLKSLSAGICCVAPDICLAGTDFSARERAYVQRKSAEEKTGEEGIVLVLVAVAVVVIGVFAVLGLGMFKTRDRADFERETRARQERVVDQLSSFAQIYGRIPCPANPGLAATDAAFGQEDRGGPGALCNRTEGLVPFRALGIQASDALDGWGQFMTYGVSPVFTALDAKADTGINIHNFCRRVRIWVFDTPRGVLPDGTTLTPATDRNFNPRKAKFCCPALAWDGGPGQDVRILRSSGGIPVVGVPPVRSGGEGDIALREDDDTNMTGTSEAVAFALVSHGANESGAYVPAVGRLPGAVGDEAENADGDRDFVSRARVDAGGAAVFDDIVAWRTNYSLFAQLNSSGCMTPLH